MLEINKIYNMDCLEGIDKMIEQGLKIDAIITDPPFLHVKGGMKSKRVNTGSYKAESFVNTNMRDFDEPQIYNLLNKTKRLFNSSFNGYFFCSKLQIVSYLKWTQENKLSYDILIWDRQKYSLISTKFYTSNIDYVIRIYGKGRALNKIVNSKGKGDVEYYKKIQSYKHPKEYGHETEKPIELITKYIMVSTNENDVVLDPFIGSGTTAIACINTNRNFIGFELDKHYHDIATKRIEAQEEQMNLFKGGKQMRIYEPAQERKSNDLLAMNAIKVAHLDDWYKRFKRGVAVNDGKYLTWFDEEETNG